MSSKNPTFRDTSHLSAPPGALSGYPEEDLWEGFVLYRSHDASYGPWFFSSVLPESNTEGGRFDVSAPHGTCYTSLVPTTTLRERFGPQFLSVGAVTADAVAATKVSRILLQEHATVALTSAELAANFHTRELVATDDYALTQQWAEAFREHGFDGVVYESRFTTVADATAVGLFGEAGPKSWPVDGEEDVKALLKKAGMNVLSRRSPLRRFTKAPPPRP